MFVTSLRRESHLVSQRSDPPTQFFETYFAVFERQRFKYPQFQKRDVLKHQAARSMTTGHRRVQPQQLPASINLVPQLSYSDDVSSLSRASQIPASLIALRVSVSPSITC